MKKGFTLIELLASLVILTIIALIAVPQVLHYIEESRIRSAIISGSNYVKAVNNKISLEESKGNLIPSGEYVIGENEIEIDAEHYEDIFGGYTVSTTGVVWAGLCVKNYPIEYTDGKASYNKTAKYCTEDAAPYVEPNATILSELCKGDDAALEELYSATEEFKIRKVEDLVCFSNITNKGKYFDNKKIYLVNDIDINNTNSYYSHKAKGYDINDNDNFDEEVYTELTTGAGFRPIKDFKGEFYGYAFTISNLMINRPSQSNVGLFGSNTGKIIGLKMRGANVQGYSNVGILVGNNSGGTYDGVNIKNVDIQGTVKGNYEHVGGIVGNGGGFTRITDFVFKGNVTGKYWVGGVIGYSENSSNTAVGVVYDTIIKADNINMGTITTWSMTYKNVMVSDTTTMNNSGTGYNGTVYTENDMMIFDRVLDTIIGGDNDSDGYYFDYDSDGNITLYSTDRKPIRVKLKGKGTEESPYLISNVKEWNMISRTIDETPKYYSVIADIDFTGQTYYPIGSNANKFNGVLKGNHHTISGVTVSGYDNVGLFGYNTGTIQDIKFNNITVTGLSNNVGIVANNTGTLRGIVVRNANVQGYSNVGILVGNNSGGTYDGVNIKNVDIQGTVKGNYEHVGGIVGNGGSFTRITDFVFKGNVTGKYWVGGVIGYSENSNNTAVGVVYDTTLKADNINMGTITTWSMTYKNVMVSDTTTMNNSGTGHNGTIYTENDMMVFDRVLDTIIGGDNDEDGYYFDYDSNKHITMYSTDERPLKNKLKGSGTENDPYLIASVSDWNTITTTIDETPKYYSVTADIDFTDEVYYPIGTNANKFNGVLKGNHHTISGVTVVGYDNVGLFGYNTGTIKDIKFNNITVTGLSNNVGIIANNTGTLRGIVVRNANVQGYSNVGILVGNNSGGTYDGVNIKNVDIQGTVKGNYEHVGGIVGNGGSFTRITDFVFKGNVTGKYWVGGVIGYSENSYNTAVGVVYDTTLKADNINMGTITTWSMNYKNVMVSDTTTMNNSGTGHNGTVYTENDMAIFDRVLDTIIGGDNDLDGYYFDYDSHNNITLYSTDERPITNTLQGTGTESNPYLISNADEWNMIVGTIGSTPKYYSVTADIDFTGKTYYPIGTNANKFNGVLKGNHHTISGVTVSGYDNVGLFGYNTGTIRDIKFNNITVTGSNDNVGIIANNSGTLRGIVVRNTTVQGRNNVGILVGRNTGGTYDGVNIKNVDVQGTVRGTENVGGIVGEGADFTRITDFVFKGTVTGSYWLGGVIGRSQNSYNTAVGVVYDTTITGQNTNIGTITTWSMSSKNVMVSNTTTSPSGTGHNGTAYTASDMTLFDRVLDTYIGGDNDLDGYYFDFDSNNNITMYSTDERPITNTLQGTGSEGNPYIINSASDWRMATATVTQGKYYSLSTNIDFTNQKYYPLGTNANKFGGTLLGNHHTISGVTTGGYDNVGLFGYNTGTIKDINFSNITITGTYDNVGIIANNTGTLRGIVVRNATVQGRNNVGILVGRNSGGAYNNTNIKNADIRGTVSGTENVGGIVGEGADFTRITDFVFKGTITGSYWIGGVIGRSQNSYNTAVGVVYDTSITSENTNVGTITTWSMSSKNVLVLNTTVNLSGTGHNGTVITDRTLEAVNSAIDTTIGGDNDNDGYYFTLNGSNYELIQSN